ncbi:hypothetical protein PG984_007208 [Apiospora sp. TS-2023a]
MSISHEAPRGGHGHCERVVDIEQPQARGDVTENSATFALVFANAPCCTWAPQRWLGPHS